jgi:hypothetical protein
VSHERTVFIVETAAFRNFHRRTIWSFAKAIVGQRCTCALPALYVCALAPGVRQVPFQDRVRIYERCFCPFSIVVPLRRICYGHRPICPPPLQCCTPCNIRVSGVVPSGCDGPPLPTGELAAVYYPRSSLTFIPRSVVTCGPNR